MKGIKTGGRQKGSKNKLTNERKAIVERATRSGILPKEYMLKVMRNPKVDAKRRDAMAVSAAPYCHAKYQTVELTGQGGNAVQVEGEIKISVEFV
ncbi:MAG: hypothetical protein ACLQF1_06505 [Methyloceanibacter sp.]